MKALRLISNGVQLVSSKNAVRRGGGGGDINLRCKLNY